MATVENVIKQAQYDLRDFGWQDFDEDQALEYMNRAIHLFDSSLIAMKSDRSFAEDLTKDLLVTEYSVTPPTNCDSIDNIWIGTDKKIQISTQDMFYKRQLYTGQTGEPVYWAYNGETIIFEQDASATFDLVIHYWKLTGALAIDANMPYNDKYNKYLRQAMIALATAAKHNKIEEVDMVWSKQFKQLAMEDVVRRTHVKRRYRLDF